MSTIESSGGPNNTGSGGGGFDQRGRIRNREELVDVEILDATPQNFPFKSNPVAPLGLQLFPSILPSIEERREKVQKTDSQTNSGVSESLQKSFDTLLAVHTWIAEDRLRLLKQRDQWLFERASLLSHISHLRGTSVSPSVSSSISAPSSDSQPFSLKLDQVSEVKFHISIPSPSKSSGQKSPLAMLSIKTQ